MSCCAGMFLFLESILSRSGQWSGRDEIDSKKAKEIEEKLRKAGYIN